MCPETNTDSSTDDIVALERAALDRWGNGDPTGFLEIYAPDISYFDPGIERRLDGHDAMTEYYRPIAGLVKVLRYEMIGPKVQRDGDVAVLSYNLSNDGILPDGREVSTRWNSTAVYSRASGAWRVIHSHWSLTTPPSAQGVI